jgi:UDP-N-acetyl-D-galactosamine dehydrogenase
MVTKTFAPENNKIAVIGLGYVGLPLAIEFSKKYKTVGFDINFDKVRKIQKDFLKTAISNKLSISDNIDSIKNCNIYIITVPTPINKFRLPDLSFLEKASELVGTLLKIGDIVIYESTVYPGCTEEFCVPILQSKSGLIFNKDFFCGYSPERISPGDPEHTLTNIVKVTSGSTPEIAEKIDSLYNSIIKVGTYKASSIKIAEASKAIENAQRDINISFVNELALIFDKLGIDTTEVLEAASTKWNFLNFKPGLVGGHCIGVDPYYLAFKAKSIGYYPEVILSGRNVNDQMGNFVATKIVKLLIRNGLTILGSKVLILGITFKENFKDVRNSRVIDIYHELKQFGMEVDIYDPHADTNEVLTEYNINLIESINSKYEAIIVSVAHEVFKLIDYKSLKSNEKAIIYDIKSILPKELVDGRL